MAHDVFVSYSTPDRSIADAIAGWLERDAIHCWIAPRDVRPGAPYAEEIVEAVHTSRIMVLVLSSHANLSPHVLREVERAVHEGVPIIPLRIEDVLPSKSLEYFLSPIHWLDALTPPLEAHLTYLAETVRLLLSRQTDGKARPPFGEQGRQNLTSRGPHTGQFTWSLPFSRTWIFAVAALVPLQFTATFLLHWGPPWPDRNKVAVLGSLVMGITLPWVHSSWDAIAPRNRAIRRSLLGSLSCGLLMIYLALSAFFVYDAPTPSNQEAGGFVLQPSVAELLRQNPSMTVEEVVQGAEYNPNAIWVPWTVASVRLALLFAWLGLIGGASATVATFFPHRMSSDEHLGVTPRLGKKSYAKP